MLQDRFLPAKVVARRPGDADDSTLPACLRPLLEGKRTLDGQTTLYVCQRGTCQAPVAGLPAIEALLRNSLRNPNTTSAIGRRLTWEGPY